MSSTTKTLDQLALRTSARIEAFVRDEGVNSAQNRFNQSLLSDMGACPGEKLEVLHRAPMFSDPIAVRIGNRTISMRRHLARSIEVLELD